MNAPVYAHTSAHKLVPVHCSVSKPGRDLHTVRCTTRTNCRRTLVERFIFRSTSPLAFPLVPHFPQSMRLEKNTQTDHANCCMFPSESCRDSSILGELPHHLWSGCIFDALKPAPKSFLRQVVCINLFPCMHDGGSGRKKRHTFARLRTQTYLASLLRRKACCKNCAAMISSSVTVLFETGCIM